ncbi:hypothetical protein CP980_08185 [Streptomyces vinaceus]|uniref:Uncharacterized protein n=1 Tax=Streptomyces vinaceus TaxID=1960 RepID=A0A5J6J2E1_STRVI|nr:hypothetical protein [Streptomyces vinaceus]QEV45040.1 hypothetical protein CP980_08185 [Streptomyces vinaceus]GHE51291.1 hypothetical protein GCM10017778_39350 [Streptomyces vinaceus]
MATTPHRRTTNTAHAARAARAKVTEALAARDALAAALSRAGIQLPAMDVRTPWPEERADEARYALVHLGVCSAPVAHALATVIAKGAAG